MHTGFIWPWASDSPWSTKHVVGFPSSQTIKYWLKPCMVCLWQYRLRPRQNWRHFADDIFKCIVLNENAWISLRISLEFVPKVRINNIPALVQIMAWGRPGDKPLSEPVMVSLLTHICVTLPQWVKVCLSCYLVLLSMTWPIWKLVSNMAYFFRLLLSKVYGKWLDSLSRGSYSFQLCQLNFKTDVTTMYSWCNHNSWLM